MKQSRLMSLVESFINIAVGFGISLGAQVVFLPMLGVVVDFHQNLIFALIMTVISIVRSYLLRRVFEAFRIRRPLSPFMQAVIAERFRQIEAEGWSVEHDDDHPRGKLSQAGAVYLLAAGSSPHHVPPLWPWADEWWKPVGFRRDLVKGAALAIAEGEKFDRGKTKFR
ncbi:hypothetical protein LPW26_05960 [Rhodopseudomonas sp. HC1]|uniref:DUF7220 family protein n=1 Tax=Rhodopseudomonas infernalis TaxID=2897386 RepID=UPI001EE974DA|nr:hypothetical protein [Rhodopseudomonas infernalis]MCG6204171.1 hypothetical protein [Rhodopseudomonas infernalis]